MSEHVENGNGSTNGAPGDYFDLKSMHHILKELDRRPKIMPDVLEFVGITPLVKLNKIPQTEGIECDMYAKCEFFNPGGSVKDRIGYRMVLEAERNGILVPGKSVIIEPTSGNTGIGLALVAAVKGYKCIIVLPEKMSNEKVNTLLALGAQVVRTPDVPTPSPESNINVAKRLASEIEGAVVLDQYDNPNNPLAHYDGTAEEILWSLDDDVDMVVMGAGTSGSVSGTSHKLKDRCPKCVVVGVDPYGSILAQPDAINKTDVTYYEVEGLGYDFLPQVLDRAVVDRWVKTNDKDSLNMSRRLIKEEGLLCGGSSGSAMWGALQAAKSLKKGQKCVVLLPDSIRNYMTKFITDQWMEARDFKPVVSPLPDIWWWNTMEVAHLAQPVHTVKHTATTADAIAALRSSRAPLVAIVGDNGTVTSVFTADHARKRLANLGGKTAEPLEKFALKKFYKVDASRATLGLVSRLLDIAPFVFVTKIESGVEKPLGVITSDDLLLHVEKEKHINGK